MVVDLVSNCISSLQLDLSKAIGQNATLREVVDNHYVGTLRDNLAAGVYSIQLTLDGSSSTATVAFTMPG